MRCTDPLDGHTAVWDSIAVQQMSSVKAPAHHSEQQTSQAVLFCIATAASWGDTTFEALAPVPGQGT